MPHEFIFSSVRVSHRVTDYSLVPRDHEEIMMTISIAKS
jgi:hypothetical protein